jgi:hypothetical protein
MLCTSVVKSIASLGKIVKLRFASRDNSFPLGGKVALYSSDAQMIISADYEVSKIE